jgi:hypothetical protein
VAAHALVVFVAERQDDTQVFQRSPAVRAAWLLRRVVHGRQGSSLDRDARSTDTLKVGTTTAT